MNNNNGELDGGLKDRGGGAYYLSSPEKGVYKRGGLFEGGWGVGGLNRGFTVLKQSQLDTE